MNKENTDKLLKRFPVLYQDYYDPMSHSCMCWGFEHGDGWFEIIWQLSLSIEDALGYTPLQKRWFLLKKKYAKKWNDLIYRLSPVVYNRYVMKGTGAKGDPFQRVLVELAPDCDWLMTLAKKLPDRSSDFKSTIGHFQSCGLKHFVVHPDTGFKVSQIKEKFGTLRFYCNIGGTIGRYVSFAERLSAMTCDFCGKYGKTECVRGWYRTVCKDHSQKVED